MILTEPKNAITKQYKKLFRMEGIDLSFSDDALDYIAEKSIALKLGARGLRSMCENIMGDAMYEMPSKQGIGTLLIDLHYVMSRLEQSDMIQALRIAA